MRKGGSSRKSSADHRRLSDPTSPYPMRSLSNHWSSKLFKITTSVEISADTRTIWNILRDFEKYGEWNPFIRSIKGDQDVGARLTVFLQPSGTRGMRFKPRLLQFSEERGIRWLGRLAIPGLFDGEHSFAMSKNADGSVRFVQEETFRGILVPLLRRSLERDTKRGFEEMNRALKARSEKVG
jgi:hypothetical protein